MSLGRVLKHNVRPNISGNFQLEQAVAAFEHAGGRRSAMKVQLIFAGG